MDALWVEIDTGIHQRKLDRVRELIPKYLRLHRGNLDAIYEASEFYRRISEYSLALKILPKERPATAWPKMSRTEKRLQLQLARILNMLGASALAVRMAQALSEEERSLFSKQVSGIFLSNYRFREAKTSLAPLESLPADQMAARGWLEFITLGDCYSGIGATENALKCIQKVRANTSSPLILGICHQAQGEYLIRSGDLTAAWGSLIEAEKYFSPTDRTHDFALLKKWKGVCLGLRGDSDAAIANLREAFELLYLPGFKPEGWLEILYWIGKFEKRAGEIPETWARILAYEGLPHPISQRILRDHPLSPEWCFSATEVSLVPKRVHFDRESDLKIDGKQISLGLDLVDELISLLAYGGPHGVPQFRLYEILWPDEPFSFQQMQKRLEQLILRARENGFEIDWKDQHLWLKSKNLSASPRPAQVIRGLRFLRSAERFKRADVQEYFGISQASAGNLCRDWLKKGLISSASNSFYEVRKSTLSR